MRRTACNAVQCVTSTSSASSSAGASASTCTQSPVVGQRNLGTTFAMHKMYQMCVYGTLPPDNMIYNTCYMITNPISSCPLHTQLSGSARGHNLVS